MTDARIRRLRGVERMYLALESPTTPMHFGAVVVLDGRSLLDAGRRLPLTELRRRLEARLADLPDLRRIARGAGPLAGGPLWVDEPDFRIERHVDEVRLPPADAGAEETGLFAFIEARLLAPLLDRRHPLWRLWFVTGLADRRVAVVVIVHHALTDGLGAMRLLGGLLGDETTRADPIPSLPASRSPRWRDLAVDHWRSLSRQAAVVLRPAKWRELAALARTFRAGMRAARGERSTSLNAPVGSRRRLVVRRFELRAVKDVARTLDVGVNDVVLGLVTGGVRALRVVRGEPIAGFAPRVGLAVTLPPSERRDAGNHFGGFVVPLPITDADPLARIRSVAASREAAKRTQGVSEVTAIRVWSARFGPTRALMARQRVIHLMETFLPGPPRPITLLGAPVLDLVPIQPLGRNVGLTFLGVTYAGCLNVVVRADPDAFPELEAVLTGMADTWEGVVRQLGLSGRSNTADTPLTSTLGSGAPAGRRPEGRCDGSRARRAGTARGPGGVRRPRPRAR